MRLFFCELYNLKALTNPGAEYNFIDNNLISYNVLLNILNGSCGPFWNLTEIYVGIFDLDLLLVMRRMAFQNHNKWPH